MKVNEQPAHADKEEARGRERASAGGVRVAEPPPLDRPDEPMDGLNVVNKQIGPDGLPFTYYYLRNDQRNLMVAQMEGFEIVQDNMPEVAASEDSPIATPRVLGDTVLARIPTSLVQKRRQASQQRANEPVGKAGRAALESEADKVRREVLEPRYGKAEVQRMFPKGMVFEETRGEE